MNASRQAGIPSGAGQAAAWVNDATGWAWHQTGLKPKHKLVLLAVARHALRGPDVWPSLSTLAELTGFDRKTVRAVLAELETLGKIADTGRRAGRTAQVRVLRILCNPAPMLADQESGDAFPPSPAPAPTEEAILATQAAVSPPQSVHPRDGREKVLEEIKQEGQGKEQPISQASAPERRERLPAHPHRPASGAWAGPRTPGRTAGNGFVASGQRRTLTATGLPNLPPPAPMPANIKTELARIRAQSHTRTFDVPAAGRLH